MEIGTYKVLVLGAGASMNYGYPSGASLRQQILAITPKLAEGLEIIVRGSNVELESFIRFNETFRYSQLSSIDAFLGRRPEFTEVGKRCIAAVLLAQEKDAKLFNEKSSDHWYQYLLNRFSTREWEELDFSDLAIITFNYDRSLEVYLYSSLQAAYDKSPQEVAEKMSLLRIVHIYGALCPVLPNDPSFISYDAQVNWDKITRAAKGLRVIPENRADSETLAQARQLLSGASAVCFLGFGFDDLNVERLSEGGACGPSITTPQGIIWRNHVGTRLGVYDAELHRALNKLYRRGISDAGSGFVDAQCLATLRSSGFLL